MRERAEEAESLAPKNLYKSKSRPLHCLVWGFYGQTPFTNYQNNKKNNYYRGTNWEENKK